MGLELCLHIQRNIIGLLETTEAFNTYWIVGMTVSKPQYSRCESQAVRKYEKELKSCRQMVGASETSLTHLSLKLYAQSLECASTFHMVPARCRETCKSLECTSAVRDRMTQYSTAHHEVTKQRPLNQSKNGLTCLSLMSRNGAPQRSYHRNLVGSAIELL